MIKSMTGYGSAQSSIAPFGKISVELRSTNHKFLETVLHLPEGFIAFEERIKKEIEQKLKRGRVTCVITLSSSKESDVFVNNALLKKYLRAFKNIQSELRLKDSPSLDTLIHLPGVVTLAQNSVDKLKLWPYLRALLRQAVGGLATMRQKEGRAMQAVLRNTLTQLLKDLEQVKLRFARAIKAKTASLVTDEEKSSFLKNADITEEIERLAYHSQNLSHKLSSSSSVGKELDFIAQEMQRETNTMGAKSCDASISAVVVEIKSKIEKIREQVQNIE